MSRENLLSFLFLFAVVVASAQPAPESIKLRNSSFEGYPQPSVPPDQWVDCGFPDESPPDTQPFGSSLVSSWGQRIQPQEGFSYLGMVIRDNDTWERVSQRLTTPLEGGKCYQVSVFLSSSPTYISQSRATQKFVNYNEPCVLRIRAATFTCESGEILAESPTVQHNFWKRYQFTMRPTTDVEYLMLEAFYKTPTLFSYNGNILVDNISPIIEVDCDEEPAEDPITDEIADTNPEPEEVTQNATDVVRNDPPSRPQAADNASTEPEESVPNTQKILAELERGNLEVGKTIQIETLIFDTDSYVLGDESYPVLNEISQFLRVNKDVVVEIGGHTSRQPGIDRDYCINLSKSRAKSVRDYLVDNGVNPNQLSYKGYGYNKPVANNVSKAGRLKNQRVEIKVIKIEI